MDDQKSKLEDNPERDNHIYEILTKHNIIKTDQTINFKLNINNYNHVNGYLVNQNGYDESTKITITNINQFPLFKIKDYYKSGDILINVNLVDEKFYIQRGLILNQSLPYGPKKHFNKLVNPNDPRFKGDLKNYTVKFIPSLQ